MIWQQVVDRWSSGWKNLLDGAMKQYEEQIQQDPHQFTDKVQEMFRELSITQHRLLALKSKVDNPVATQKDKEHYDALSERYLDLAAGVYAHVRKASDEPKVEGAPLIIGGLIIGVAAIAWAIAAMGYTTHLREETVLKDKDLEARIRAAEQGYALQPSTVSPPDKPDENKQSTWLPAVSLGGAGVLTLAFLYYLTRKI